MMFTYDKLGKNGRFGNQLFQIASTIGIAKSNGFSYGFPEWKYQEYFVNELPQVNGTTRSLTGYLQDYKLFKNCESEIRKLFTMVFNTIDMSNTVFIHHRAYDTEGVSKIHPVQTREYFEKAMAQFPDKEFLLFTDVYSSAQKVGLGNIPLCMADEMQSFYMMTQCEGAIISNSTFSWWAAWLQNKKTVIPKNWFTKEAIDKNPVVYNPKGLYMPNWIAI